MSEILIILSLSLLLPGIISFFLSKRKCSPSPAPPPEDTEECCGRHLVCEKELYSGMGEKIEYYDDEELDTFKLKDPASYSDNETEQFREVLYTLAPQETEGWLRSLQQRGIELPLAFRDEALMMVQEQRNGY